MSDRIANADISEIEITPDMIEVGVEVFCGHDRRFVAEEETVIQIFKSMIELSAAINCYHPKKSKPKPRRKPKKETPAE